MSAIRTLNLVWQRSVRSAYGPARFSLADSGALTIALPRPLETRKYDLTLISPDEAEKVLSTFSVETLGKLEATSESAHCIGITADDLYLFREGKHRFMPEQRITLADAAISADGARVACGFSDMSGGSFAIALGEMSGAVTWVREVDSPVLSVALSGDGGRMAVALESGIILMLDRGRRLLWMFEMSAPATAMALSRDGFALAVGSADGNVGLIDSEGVRRWKATTEAPITAIACANRGTLVALVDQGGDEGSARFACFDGDGRPGPRFDMEARRCSVSVSPDGSFATAGGRDGALSLYRVVYAAAAPLDETAVDAEQASRELAAAGRGAAALHALRVSLRSPEVGPAMAQELLACQEELLVAERARLGALLDSGAAGEAVEQIESLLAAEPRDSEVVALLNRAYRQHADGLASRAAEQIEAGDLDQAEALLRRAVAEGAPEATEARGALASLRAERARLADAEADAAMAAGRMEDAVAALERAQAEGATAERAARLEAARIAEDFAAGMEAYDEKRYSAAVFQFKKVLAKSRDHREAQRYLNFAQKFAQATEADLLADRFSRLDEPAPAGS